MKKVFSKGKVLAGTTLLAAALISGCGDSENFVFTNSAPAAQAQAPLAQNDAFNALGDATVNQAASGVLANDTLNGATISSFDVVGSQGGGIALNPDGSFSYTPVTGFVGSETFSYTLSNSAGSSTGTVTMTSTGFGRFVDNSVPDGGIGTQADPFDTLGEAVAVAQPGDVIFVARGDGSNTGMQGGLTLPQGVDLIGEGSGLILAQTVVPAGQAPTIEGPINCLGDNLIQGLTIDGSASDLIQINTVADVTVNDCTLANPTADHILATDVSGTLTITNNTLTSPSGGDYICIDNDGVDATAVVTDNTFTNPNATDFDAMCEVTTSDDAGNMIMSVTYSRNTHDGSAADELHYGFYWDNENETGVTATLTCQDNIFDNLDDEAISSFDVAGTISGNTITNVTEAGIYCGVADQTMNINGNVMTNVSWGLYLYFNLDGANGTIICDNNNVSSASNEGVYVFNDDNNTALFALRNSSITDSGNDDALLVEWGADSDICLEIVGNTVNDDMVFDDPNPPTGALNVEQLNQLTAVNTFTPPATVDNSGALNVAQGACQIP